MHRTEGKISKPEQQRARQLIRLIYSHKYDLGMSGEWSEFSKDEIVALTWTYETQVTFLDRLRCLYPAVMKQIEKDKDINDRIGDG